MSKVIVVMIKNRKEAAAAELTRLKKLHADAIQEGRVRVETISCLDNLTQYMMNTAAVYIVVKNNVGERGRIRCFRDQYIQKGGDAENFSTIWPARLAKNLD